MCCQELRPQDVGVDSRAKYKSGRLALGAGRNLVHVSAVNGGRRREGSARQRSRWRRRGRMAAVPKQVDGGGVTWRSLGAPRGAAGRRRWAAVTNVRLPWRCSRRTSPSWKRLGGTGTTTGGTTSAATGRAGGRPGGLGALARRRGMDGEPAVVRVGAAGWWDVVRRGRPDRDRGTSDTLGGGDRPAAGGARVRRSPRELKGSDPDAGTVESACGQRGGGRGEGR
jgi:hypothetical protein